MVLFVSGDPTPYNLLPQGDSEFTREMMDAQYVLGAGHRRLALDVTRPIVRLRTQPDRNSIGADWRESESGLEYEISGRKGVVAPQKRELVLPPCFFLEV